MKPRGPLKKCKNGLGKQKVDFKSQCTLMAAVTKLTGPIPCVPFDWRVGKPFKDPLSIGAVFRRGTVAYVPTYDAVGEL